MLQTCKCNLGYHKIYDVISYRSSQVSATTMKMEFIMKYVTLFHIDPCKPPTIKMQLIMKYSTLFHIDSSQV